MNLLPPPIIPPHHEPHYPPLQSLKSCLKPHHPTHSIPTPTKPLKSQIRAKYKPNTTLSQPHSTIMTPTHPKINFRAYKKTYRPFNILKYANIHTSHPTHLKRLNKLNMNMPKAHNIGVTPSLITPQQTYRYAHQA